MKTSFSPDENIFKTIFNECELFLLKNNSIDDFLSFYARDFFMNSDELNIEHEMLERLVLLNRLNINGIAIIKIILLFKEELIKFMVKKDNNFDFKLYVEHLIEKFLQLKDVDPKQRNELLTKLEVNVKDYRINIMEEKIVDLENQMAKIKQRYSILHLSLFNFIKLSLVLNRKERNMI